MQMRIVAGATVAVVFVLVLGKTTPPTSGPLQTKTLQHSSCTFSCSYRGHRAVLPLQEPGRPGQEDQQPSSVAARLRQQ